MSLRVQSLVINNIKLPVDASVEEAFSVAEARLAKLHIKADNVKFSVFRRSTDARNRNNILFVYSICATGFFSVSQILKFKNQSVALLEDLSMPELYYGKEEMTAPPLVVGTGPSGLFCALLLAENGYAPVLIERGGSVADRKTAVERFKNSAVLDTATNIQFGAGGAGTFSDGKLVTRINDPLSSYVLRKFVEFGAPHEILYLSRPHIGTDILTSVIDRIIDRITSLGGKIYFNTQYIESSGISTAVTNNGEIPYGALVLAIGHSARDTYYGMLRNGYRIEAKPFSVGMRVEHRCNDIDSALYGDFAGNARLGHAEYNLSTNTKERGVYTFCMCPGGSVVAAASEEYGVAVNGMSEHSRNGQNSNSAIVCSIFKEDYGSTPEKAIEFQRNIERKAYLAGGSNYAAPIITVGDFINDRCSALPSDVIPTYMNGTHVKLARPEEYLPDFVCKAIKNAFFDFDTKIKGFMSSTAVLTGAETRTSAPIRILRDSETRLALNTENIYPCGEGAGYAGGITSAAIDGIKTAISIIGRYRPLK